MPEALFPSDVPCREWRQFDAAGFEVAACGVVFGAGHAQCGMPLGGIGTGCIDLDTDGTLGRCSIFNSFVPPRALGVPFLAVEAGGRVFGLTTRSLPGVTPAKQIRYWGHYPVADLEYELEGPIEAGLRAWSPFLPGDAAASNTPAAVFDVRVRNRAHTAERVRVLFSFPGPASEEAGPARTERSESAQGTVVRSGKGAYMLFATGGVKAAPGPAPDSTGAGASLALGFDLRAGEQRTVRVCLAWHFPRWAGSPAHHYLHAYATRFGGVEDVAAYIDARGDELLRRICAWQSQIYADSALPVWMRDQLVNILHTIPKDSFWAGRSFPPSRWYGPAGLLALTESPRTTPHVCNPSDWYGLLPVVFFFPELAASLLRAYAHYQLPDGEIPLGIGEGADLDSPSYHLFQVMNGCVHIQLADRLWQRERSQGVLKEFYPSVLRALAFLSVLDTDRDGLLDLDPDPIPNQFYGDWPWYGAAVHVNGFWLAALRIVERMASSAGDATLERECRDQFVLASRSLDVRLWTGTHYRLYRDESGHSSDTILANQLAGEWCARLHGLSPVFPPERVRAALETVKRTCVAATPYGVVNAIRPDGTPDAAGGRQSTGIFTGECLSVAATLAYSGDTDAALEIARRMMDDVVIRQGRGWEMPNILDASSGAALHGTDFYQMMILWALPLALSGQSIFEACAGDTLITRVLRAASEPVRKTAC